MILTAMTADDFLDDFARWRSWLDDAAYADITNDADGVVYPGICAELPAELQSEISYKLGLICEVTKINYLFARLSVSGMNPPHWAHHDGAMGKRSLMLYMNRPEHCEGGTAMLRHRDGEPSPEVWARDTNKPQQWRLESVCEMKPNRAFMFRADQWHAAMPRGGFGTDARNGRLVITAFFE